MDARLLKLSNNINSLEIKEIKNNIRNKILTEIEKLRLNNNFCNELEILERGLWIDIINKFDETNLKKLVNIYLSLDRLKFGIECVNDIVK